MTIIEAYTSGKKFKLPWMAFWYWFDDEVDMHNPVNKLGIAIEIDAKDVLSEEWEII